MAATICYKGHPNCLLSWKELQFLADLTASSWKRLLRFLGVQNSVIENVEIDGQNKRFSSSEIAFQGYLQWQHARPHKASFCVLFTMLEEAERNDVIKKMTEEFQVKGINSWFLLKYM